METTTLVSKEELARRCEAEGIDFSKVFVVAPRWAEIGSKQEGSKSALVRCDLILRSDGSAVALDGAMAMDSQVLLYHHFNGGSMNVDWDDYIEGLMRLS